MKIYIYIYIMIISIVYMINYIVIGLLLIIGKMVVPMHHIKLVRAGDSNLTVN